MSSQNHPRSPTAGQGTLVAPQLLPRFPDASGGLHHGVAPAVVGAEAALQHHGVALRWVTWRPLKEVGMEKYMWPWITWNMWKSKTYPIHMSHEMKFVEIRWFLDPGHPAVKSLLEGNQHQLIENQLVYSPTNHHRSDCSPSDQTSRRYYGAAVRSQPPRSRARECCASASEPGRIAKPSAMASHGGLTWSNQQVTNTRNQNIGDLKPGMLKTYPEHFVRNPLLKFPRSFSWNTVQISEMGLAFWTYLSWINFTTKGSGCTGTPFWWSSSRTSAFTCSTFEESDH